MRSIVFLHFLILVFVIYSIIDFYRKKIPINTVLIFVSFLLFSFAVSYNFEYLLKLSRKTGFQLASNFTFLIGILFCALLSYEIYKKYREIGMKIKRLERELLIIEYFERCRDQK
jgi:hypothetical protein